MNFLAHPVSQPPAESRPASVGTSRRPAIAAAAALAIASLVLHLAIMRAFQKLGVYFFNDVLFASDSHDFLATLSHGQRSHLALTPDLQNSIHPYVWFYFAPFVRLAAKAFAGLTGMSELDLRLLLGAFVVPLVAALQSFAFGLLLALIGFGTSAVLLGSLLNVLSFSNLLYGSIPDHFAITNFAITVILIAAVLAARRRRFDRSWVWAPLGLFATGITITNAIVLGIAHFFTRLFSPTAGFWRAAAQSTSLAVLTIAFVLATAVPLARWMDGPREPHAEHRDFVGSYLRVAKSPVERLTRTARAAGNAIAPATTDLRALPAKPAPQEHYAVSRPPWANAPLYPVYTIETDRSPPLSALAVTALAGMLAGAAAMVARGGVYRMLGLVAIAIVAFNFAFHSAWGDEFVLYSQHWLTAFLLLFSGLFLVPGRLRGAIAVGVAGFIIAVAWNNAAFFWTLLTAMQGIAAGAGALSG